MDIIKDISVRNRWHKGFNRSNNSIEEIVIHATGGGETFKYVLSGGRAELYKKGIALFHYLIQESGNVIEIIDPLNYVYHSSSNDHDKKTIGIEIEKRTADNSNEPSETQISNLVELINYLACRFNTIKTIVSHDYNRIKYSGLEPKPCPGQFDWEYLEETLLNSGIQLSIHP